MTKVDILALAVLFAIYGTLTTASVKATLKHSAKPKCPCQCEAKCCEVGK